MVTTIYSFQDTANNSTTSHIWHAIIPDARLEPSRNLALMSSTQKQIGNYILDRQIGSGANSEVWLAHHMHLTLRKVAIKVLTSQNREVVMRFAREASIAARLQHANIVRLIDYGRYEPTLYCSIFEYIEGGSLAEFLERNKRVELTYALKIFRDIASALDYAHGLGVVHRDVSPGNILLAQSTGQGFLTDFGIAREPRTSLTTMSAIMGTPGFWSPEHLRSATAVTHLSDLYSLGVVFYMMLSGQLPWEEAPDSPRSVFQPPIPLRQRGVEHLPSTVDRVFQTLLAVDPAKRYPNAKAALDDLDRIFARHTGITEIVHGKGKSRDDDESEHRLTADELDYDDVERALGPDCLRAPLVDARARAVELRDPDVIAGMLNDWSSEHRWRQPLLGRIAELHDSDSYNLYFYDMKLLFEQRTAPEIEEVPDADGAHFDLEPELDRWQVPLASPRDFEDVSKGETYIPGSEKVLTCRTCDGKGKVVCPKCHGTRRIKVLRPVENPSAGGTIRRANMSSEAGVAATAPPPPQEEKIIACDYCDGAGGMRCENCQGVGRLLQRKYFRWNRWSSQHANNDTPAEKTHQEALKSCKPRELYNEQSLNGLRSEWQLVPQLKSLLEQAMSDIPPDTKVVLSQVAVSFVPVTEIVFDLGERDSKEGDQMRMRSLFIYGFEHIIPNDWSFFAWQRIYPYCIAIFMTLVAVVAFLIAFFR